MLERTTRSIHRVTLNIHELGREYSHSHFIDEKSKTQRKKLFYFILRIQLTVGRESGLA